MLKKEFYGVCLFSSVEVVKIWFQLVGCRVAYPASLRFVDTAGDVKTLMMFCSECRGILTYSPLGDRQVWSVDCQDGIGEKVDN
jgi:hypothetical protein